MDRLNNLSTEYDAEQAIREFYSVMEIDDLQKKERAEIAKDMYDVLNIMFLLIAVAKEYDYINKGWILYEFRSRFGGVVEKYTFRDGYMNTYIDRVSNDLLENTLNHLDDDSWLSKERSLEISVNESNTIMNYTELKEAADQGFTMKTWHTQRDNRVRKSHRAVEGKTIPINDYFEVGGGEMLFPRDYVNNPEECVNCRCSLSYE